MLIGDDIYRKSNNITVSILLISTYKYSIGKPLTQKSIIVTVGCGEPHPVVPLEGVSCLGTAGVATHLQTVVLVLTRHAEMPENGVRGGGGDM